ncbi:MAG TPA: 30S ribosomal protein S16 [Tissierellaceae bacterium]|nr:30S ribosomal protein S16 [Tissierellaceae bacterium]
MAVRIRLKRIGAKKNPFYRIVVADSRRAVDGRFIEEIGYYDPLTDPKIVKVDNEKAINWIKNGAKPTNTVDRLFRNHGVYDETAPENTEEVVEETVEETVEEAVEETVENTVE